MRHGKKHNHLGRTTSHRRAMLANMASSLIEHKRITTTLAKAKALRVYVEPILTKAKTDNTHSRRSVFSYLQSKDAVTELFRDIAVKIADRPGGYTRIIKMENRLGDNAEMALIELVDYNTIYGKETAAPAKKATRRRGGSGAGKATTPAEGAATAEVTPADDATVVEDAPVAATTVEETPATETPKAEGNITEAVATEEAPAADPSAEEATDNEDKAEKGE